MRGVERACDAVCQCGATALAFTGAAITVATCTCESCVTAAQQFEREPGAPKVLREGGVDYVLMRKDRVTLVRGRENLSEHRLTLQSPTRRVVAKCCNSPMFLDFGPGHWISLYNGRFGDPQPQPRMRAYTPMFFLKLLGSWVAMRFRRPAMSF